MTLEIRPAEPAEAGLEDLIAAHKTWLRTYDPDGTDHTRNAAQLAAAGVEMLVAVQDGHLVGMGGIYAFATGQGEIKSVFVRTQARGLGLGRGLMEALIDRGRSRGLTKILLETGTHASMAPARALYETLGFRSCPPFGSYQLDPSSAYYRLDLVAV